MGIAGAAHPAGKKTTEPFEEMSGLECSRPLSLYRLLAVMDWRPFLQRDDQFCRLSECHADERHFIDISGRGCVLNLVWVAAVPPEKKPIFMGGGECYGTTRV